MNASLVGQRVEVRFFQGVKGLAARSNAFAKIGFIDRTRSQPSVAPQLGEDWLCYVTGDSKQSEPQRGAMFLQLLERITEKERWSFAWQHETRKLEVTWTVSYGQQVLESDTWLLTSAVEANIDWPGDVIEQIQDKFEARDQQEQQAAREAELAAIKLAQAAEKSYTRLTDPTSLLVTRIDRATHTLTMSSDHSSVLLDGAHQTNLPHWYFPKTVEVLSIHLSDDSVVTVQSHCLRVAGMSEDAPDVQTAFTDTVMCHFVDRRELTWGEAEQLQEGDVFATQFKFQWSGNWMTNGVVWFPRARPSKSEWRLYPIQAIPEALWVPFLEGLEGKVLIELLPYRKEFISRGTKRSVPLTPRQLRVSALLEGCMWGGSEGCEEVSIGRNLIFAINSSREGKIYVVDNPGIGAIFVFTDYDQARDLASGKRSRTDARNSGATRIIHAKQWEAKLTALLSTM